MWLGSYQHVNIDDIPVLSTQVKVTESARDLGVVLDSQLSLSSHAAVLCRAGFFHLRQLCQAVRSMTTTTAKTAVQAFICCHLDYCNSMLYGMSDGFLWKVQSIQKITAARLVTGARLCDHIMPVLHWLPDRQWVEYKVACLVYQLLAGQTQTPAYITNDIQLIADSDRRHLHSAAAIILFQHLCIAFALLTISNNHQLIIENI